MRSVGHETPQIRSAWHHVQAYFGLVPTEADERIAANPEAESIDGARQNLRAGMVASGAVIVFGDSLLPDTALRRAVQVACAVAEVLLWRRSAVLRREALRVAAAATQEG